MAGAAGFDGCYETSISQRVNPARRQVGPRPAWPGLRIRGRRAADRPAYRNTRDLAVGSDQAPPAQPALGAYRPR